MYKYKRNGFTLVELMAVITIISLIALLTFPNIINQIKKTKKSNNKMIEDVVIEQAKKYIHDNPNEFNDDVYCLPISILFDKGYINEDLIKIGNDSLEKKYITFNKLKETIINDKCNLNPGYIQEDLYVLLDGKNNDIYGKIQSADKWYDLSGNENNFIFVNDVNYLQDSYFLHNNTTTVNDNTSYIYNDSELLSFSRTKSFSFELVFLRVNNNGNILSSIQGTTYNEIWSNNSFSQICIRFLNQRYCSGNDYNIANPTYISVTFDSKTGKIKYYINGNLVYATGTGFNSVEYGITLGMRKFGSSSKSRFFAFRYYNKELSQDEIDNNFNIDKQRYKIIG